MSTIHSWLISVVISLIPMAAIAGWQVSKPDAVPPQQAFFHAQTRYKEAGIPAAYSSAALPNQYAHLGSDAPVYAVSISGSLKENIERIMGRYHWKVIWKAPYDYNFDGRVTGASLTNVVEKLFRPFPLQAVMYMSNRTLTVVQKK